MNDANATTSLIDQMDRLVGRHEGQWNVTKAMEIVQDVFAIDLREISKRGEGRQAGSYDDDIKRLVAQKLDLDVDSEALMNELRTMEKIDLLAMRLEGREITGPLIREAVNQIFGVNLEGISSLVGSGISIYSKGQWILREKGDRLVVKTSADDSQIEVSATAAYRSHPRWRRSFDRLRESLTRLGFVEDERDGGYVYREPRGESVSDAFKAELFSTLKENIDRAFEGDR